MWRIPGRWPARAGCRPGLTASGTSPARVVRCRPEFASSQHPPVRPRAPRCGPPSGPRRATRSAARVRARRRTQSRLRGRQPRCRRDPSVGQSCVRWQGTRFGPRCQAEHLRNYRTAITPRLCSSDSTLAHARGAPCRPSSGSSDTLAAGSMKMWMWCTGRLSRPDSSFRSLSRRSNSGSNHSGRNTTTPTMRLGRRPWSTST